MNRFFTLLLAASCLTAVGQSEYCLEGTVWDDLLEGCVPATECTQLADLDDNGNVGTTDLLLLLSEFGLGLPDEDEDGICDAIDDCVGDYDECGICNGPGPIIPVVVSIVTLYDSIYAAQIDEWLVFEIGADTIFSFECAYPDTVTDGFVCGDSVTYQNVTYSTASIAGQCWYAENVKYTPNAEELDGEGSYVFPGEIFADADYRNQMIEFFGPYYSQVAINEWQLCPAGWRVPDEKDFSRLLLEPGYALRDTSSIQAENEYGTPNPWPGGWLNDCAPQLNGFNARPGGSVSDLTANVEIYTNTIGGEPGFLFSGIFASFGFKQFHEGDGSFRFIVGSCEHPSIARSPWCTNPGHEAYSIRCVKDIDVLTPGCTVELAVNYDPLAEYDDGTCEFQVLVGDTVTYWGVDYPTVIVGDAEWFAKDLETDFYSNGEGLFSPPDPLNAGCSDFYGSLQTALEEDPCTSVSVSGYCGQYWSNDLIDNAENLGLLESGYFYSEVYVNDERGLCPAGWHISTDDDWQAIELLAGMGAEVVNNLGYRGEQGVLLKSESLWLNNGDGFNALGLNFLPVGRFRNLNPSDQSITDPFAANKYISLPLIREFSANRDGILRDDSYPKLTGGRVRCVKDAE